MDRTSIVAGQSVVIIVNTADSDGSVAHVTIHVNDVPIPDCANLGAPFMCTWNPVAGVYSITAAATDNGGASTTSEAIQVTIEAKPVVTPEPSYQLLLPFILKGE